MRSSGGAQKPRWRGRDQEELANNDTSAGCLSLELKVYILPMFLKKKLSEGVEIEQECSVSLEGFPLPQKVGGMAESTLDLVSGALSSGIRLDILQPDSFERRTLLPSASIYLRCCLLCLLSQVVLKT